MLKLVELFSGIGSQAEALGNIGVDYTTIRSCEWNFHANVAYSLIHGKGLPTDDYKGDKALLIDELMEYGLSNDGKVPINRAGLQALNESTLRIIHGTIKSTNNYVDVSKIKGESLDNDIDIMTYYSF